MAGISIESHFPFSSCTRNPSSFSPLEFSLICACACIWVWMSNKYKAIFSQENCFRSSGVSAPVWCTEIELDTTPTQRSRARSEGVPVFASTTTGNLVRKFPLRKQRRCFHFTHPFIHTYPYAQRSDVKPAFEHKTERYRKGLFPIPVSRTSCTGWWYDSNSLRFLRYDRISNTLRYQQQSVLHLVHGVRFRSWHRALNCRA